MHSMLLVFAGVFTFLVDAYPLYAASALAANSFARSGFAAAFPLFGNQSKFETTFPLHHHYARRAGDSCLRVRAVYNKLGRPVDVAKST